MPPVTPRTPLEKATANAGGWQKATVTQHLLNEKEFILHTPMAPMTADQEAGGAITTPEGELKYSDKDLVIIKKPKS